MLASKLFALAVLLPSLCTAASLLREVCVRLQISEEKSSTVLQTTGLLSHETQAVVNVKLDSMPEEKMVMLRYLGKCYDFVMPIGQIFKNGPLPLLARNSRFIFHTRRTANQTSVSSEYQNKLEEASLVVERGESLTRIILSCPFHNKDRELRSEVRNLRIFRQDEDGISWSAYGKPYKLCNPGKSFYHGRHLVLGGVPGFETQQDQRVMAGLVARSLGAASVALRSPAERLIFRDDGGVVEGSGLDDALTGKVDFFTGLNRHTMSDGFLDFATHSHDYLYFATNRPEQHSQRENVLRVFDGASWTFFISSLLMVTLAFAWIANMKIWRRHFDGGSVWFLAVGMVFAEMHFKAFRGPRGPSCSGTMLRAFWLFLTTFIVLAFQANLKASLSLRSSDPVAATVDEMFARDLPVFGAGIHRASAEERRRSPLIRRWYDNAVRHNSSVGFFELPKVLVSLMKGQVKGFIYICTCMSHLPYREFYEGDLMQQKSQGSFPMAMVKQRWGYFENPFSAKKYLSQAEEILAATRRFVPHGLDRAVRGRLRLKKPLSQIKYSAAPEEDVVKLDQIVFAFVPFAAGNAAAALILLAEAARCYIRGKKFKLVLRFERSR